MTRKVQPPGQRGSLEWMQRAVAERRTDLESPILGRLPRAREIEWRSPLRDDEHAEYREASFLGRLGLEPLAGALAAFWPRHGPRWDALAMTDGGQVLLVEAKAHVADSCSPPSDAGAVSRPKIEASLGRAARALGSSRGSLRGDLFYQYADRLAHLRFLRDAGVDAWLVLVGFVGDRKMQGSGDASGWQSAYRLAGHVLGLGGRRPLTPFVIRIFPQVRP